MILLYYFFRSFIRDLNFKYGGIHAKTTKSKHNERTKLILKERLPIFFVTKFSAQLKSVCTFLQIRPTSQAESTGTESPETLPQEESEQETAEPSTETVRQRSRTRRYSLRSNSDSRLNASRTNTGSKRDGSR